MKRAALLPGIPLQPHQEEVAETGEEPEARVLLYHSLGSGKTRSAIAAAETAGDPYTAITPASLRPNFAGEQHKWTDETLPGKVVSYNSVARGQVEPADTLIYDEAHRLRNPDSLTTRNATELADRARHLYLLSGSPIVNHPHDLVPMIRMLTGKQYDPDEFDRHFIDERKISPGFWGWLGGVTPARVPAMKNRDEFDALLRGHVHYHAPDRPDVDERNEHYTTELGPEQVQLYNGFWDKLPWIFRWKLQNDFPLSRQELLRLQSFSSGPRQVGLSTYPFMRGKADALRAYQQSPKLQKAVGLMREALAKDPQMRGVAFSNFVDAGLTPYAAALRQAGIPYGIFHGGLNDAARKKVVEDYNAGRSRVLLMGPSGSEGISLKGTRLLQILDPHWNSARSDQAVGRGIRYDSHANLPLEDRNVRVQRFTAHMPRSGWQRLWRSLFGIKEERDARKGAPGIDTYLEQMARRKDELNQVFERELQRIGSEKRSEDVRGAPGAPDVQHAGLRPAAHAGAAHALQGAPAGAGVRDHDALRDVRGRVKHSSEIKIAADRRNARDAFVYMEPEAPQDEFAQCSTCTRWTGPDHRRCLILGPDLKADADDTCGLYVPGDPSPDSAGREEALVSPEEAGFREGPVRCENCVSFRPGDGVRGTCRLYVDLNAELPEQFDLDPDVHSRGCCNAQKPQEEAEAAVPDPGLPEGGEAGAGDVPEAPAPDVGGGHAPPPGEHLVADDGGDQEDDPGGDAAGYRPVLIVVRRTTVILPAGEDEEPEDTLRDTPFTIAVDLDGTIAEKEEPFDARTIGAPRAGARKWLAKFREAGARIIVFTVRGDTDLVRSWLEENEIDFDYINENPDQPADGSGKVWADVYWDDKAIRAEDLDDSGPEILEMIREKSAEDAAFASADDVLEILSAGSAA